MPSPDSLAGIAGDLFRRIDSRTAVIGVVGLGYVGLPLALACRRAGFPVVGFDTDCAKIDALRAGTPYIAHLGADAFAGLRSDRQFDCSDDPSVLARADAILICVPTPLGKHREPDLSFVLGSSRMVAGILRRGQLVVLESTTYPGTTRNEVGPLLDASGLRRNEDYFLAYSPEREDPGNPRFTASSTPKLVGGTDLASGLIAQALYSKIASSAVLVSSAEVAETAKLLENIFRAVNIALVNELKTVLADMNIDIWEVIAAASTKPFGFMPFMPGPGLGGHCIPIDPYYLTWKAREVGRSSRFIELAGDVNTAMPHYVLERTRGALNDARKSLNGARVLVVGVAYKPNIGDCRESPGAVIIELLRDGGAIVAYHDPHVPDFPSMRRHSISLRSVPLDRATVAASDCVLVVTDHDDVDYALIGRHASLVVDTRNAMQRVAAADIHARIVKS